MLLFAVVRALEVLGEAAAGVSPALRERNPQIPWRQIVSTRNRLIHGYFDIDPEVIGATVRNELPQLREALTHLLADLERLEN